MSLCRIRTHPVAGLRLFGKFVCATTKFRSKSLHFRGLFMQYCTEQLIATWLEKT